MSTSIHGTRYTSVPENPYTLDNNRTGTLVSSPDNAVLGSVALQVRYPGPDSLTPTVHHGRRLNIPEVSHRRLPSPIAQHTISGTWTSRPTGRCNRGLGGRHNGTAPSARRTTKLPALCSPGPGSDELHGSGHLYALY